MATKIDFEIDDLVWAKMKKYPFWPAQIAKPPTAEELPKKKLSASRKAQHYVFFFGTRNFAWILDENIVPHTEEMLNKVPKKQSASFSKAIREIIDISTPLPTSVKEDSSQDELTNHFSAVQSQSTTTQLIKRARKLKRKNSCIETKKSQKRNLTEEAYDLELSPLQNVSSMPSDLELSPVQNMPSVPSDLELSPVQNIPSVPSDLELSPVQNIPSVPSDLELSPVQTIPSGPPDIESSTVQKICDTSSDILSDISSDTELYETLRTFTGIPNREFAEGSVNRRGPSYFVKPTIAVRKYCELPPVPSVDLSRHNTAVLKKNIIPTSEKIGFIGLGMMGQRIVKNLLDSRHDVSVWNRTPEKCKKFVDIGVTQFLTPAELIWNCDIIFCCISGPQAVKSLVSQKDGILYGFENSQAREKAYVEMTSIDPYTSKLTAKCITEAGGRYLEAPIIGSISLAEESSLLLLTAGDQDLFIRCFSCFSAISSDPYYLGCDVGEGSNMILNHSMLTGTTNVALAEAMSLIERMNLSKKDFCELFKFSPVTCPLYKKSTQAMVKKNFSTDISLKCQQHNLNMALALSSTYPQPLELASAANQVYKDCKLNPYSEYDVSAVYIGTKCR